MAIDRQELPGAGHATQLDVPRSSKPVPEPTTRSRTVRETRIHRRRPGRGSAPRCVLQAPDVGVEQFAFAGVDAHADLDAQRLGLGAQGSAQRMACVGPSNVAR